MDAVEENPLNFPFMFFLLWKRESGRVSLIKTQRGSHGMCANSLLLHTAAVWSIRQLTLSRLHHFHTEVQ